MLRSQDPKPLDLPLRIQCEPGPNVLNWSPLGRSRETTALRQVLRPSGEGGCMLSAHFVPAIFGTKAELNFQC